MAEDLFGNDIFMKVIAAIPARANSKGLKNKNLFKINGRPLVHYTFRAFQKSKLSLGYVLSDSKKIRNLARRYSLDTNYIRPKKVSTDNTSMIDTIFDFSQKFFILIFFYTSWRKSITSYSFINPISCQIFC